MEKKEQKKVKQEAKASKKAEKKEKKKRKKRATKEEVLPASFATTKRLVQEAQAAELKNPTPGIPTPESIARERHINMLINRKLDEAEIEYKARANRVLEAEDMHKEYPDIEYLTPMDKK